MLLLHPAPGGDLRTIAVILAKVGTHEHGELPSCRGGDHGSWVKAGMTMINAKVCPRGEAFEV